MKRSLTNLTPKFLIINRFGQVCIKNCFFVKEIKKFYRFTLFELF